MKQIKKSKYVKVIWVKENVWNYYFKVLHKIKIYLFKIKNNFSVFVFNPLYVC